MVALSLASVTTQGHTCTALAVRLDGVNQEQAQLFEDFQLAQQAEDDATNEVHEIQQLSELHLATDSMTNDEAEAQGSGFNPEQVAQAAGLVLNNPVEVDDPIVPKIIETGEEIMKETEKEKINEAVALVTNNEVGQPKVDENVENVISD